MPTTQTPLRFLGRSQYCFLHWHPQANLLPCNGFALHLAPSSPCRQVPASPQYFTYIYDEGDSAIPLANLSACTQADAQLLLAFKVRMGQCGTLGWPFGGSIPPAASTFVQVNISVRCFVNGTQEAASISFSAL